ncbi:MAG: hypothetical protein AUJ54_01745 [Ignavibacteria bacterium CG1_02_37_35]|nr:MAG: hypothetical protein AUJ54_01745 [Ignavibacteria bacterium CG1_02_37_35]
MLINNLLHLSLAVKQVDINNEFTYGDNAVHDDWMEALRNIPNPISRSYILKFSEDINLEDSEQIKQFILMVLIWGYGNTAGRGHVETIINTPDITNIIKDIFTASNNDSSNWSQQSFAVLSTVSGLGTSFISKYLYFIGKCRIKQRDHINYPLIYDQKVNRALIRLSMTLDDWYINSSMSDISRGEKWENYKLYLDLIHYVSKVRKIEPDQYEYFLFKKVFNDQGVPEEIAGIA